MLFKPYEYQRTAIDFVVKHPHCGLFLDMGLGKSVISLTAVKKLIDNCEVDSVLVVAPKKVAEATWSAEASKWDHLTDLTVAKVMGPQKKRLAALASPADVYVVGRDNFAWLVGHYEGSLPFDMIVIDELTSFKNHRSSRFKALRIARPSVSRVVGLTGTPSPNGLIDLWAQMYCIDGGQRLGKSSTRYREMYFNSLMRNNIPVKTTVKPGCEQTITDAIADICLTMQSCDYLDMPPLSVHESFVELPPDVAKKYKDFERDKVLEFEESHRGESANVLANSAAGLMNKLSQFSNGAVYDDGHVAHEIHTEKLDALAELVEAANSSVLVFYQFKHDVERIRRRLKGRRVEVYDGERQLNDWNAGGIDVLLAHPASTAYGLNMQSGGHYIVWFSTGWDLELFMQANARLHRQGQKYPVTVYKLICRGTVDERASAALSDKKSKQQSLLDGLKELMKKHRHESS